MAYEGLEDNKNAEKWDEEDAIEFMNNSLLAFEEEPFDFIGELAQHMGTYRTLYNYLADKYSSCKTLLNKIQQECEANCFRHGKNSKIVPSMAIMNLKSNHGWTDRSETNVNVKGELNKYTDEELQARINELSKES